jgi:hypothetical protein
VPPRWQPSLDDYIDIAAYLLGADRAAVAALPRITLAESALHAPLRRSAAPRRTPRSSSKRRSCSNTSPRTTRCPTPTSARRFCSPRGSSTPTACSGDHQTSRRTPAWSSASPLARPRTTKSSHGSAVAPGRWNARTKRQRGLVVCRNAGETDAKSGKARTPATSPEPTESPANAADSGARAARLKIVVSPVRVRVSPSEVPESRMVAGFSSCGWNRRRAGVAGTRNGRGAPGSSNGPRSPRKRLQTPQVVVARQADEPHRSKRPIGLFRPLPCLSRSSGAVGLPTIA